MFFKYKLYALFLKPHHAGLVYMLGLYGRDDFLQEEEMVFLQQLTQERDLANAPFLFVIRKEGDENGKLSYDILSSLP